MEETRRRNEASMARKRAAKNINPAAANSAGSAADNPLSPAGTGAMDSLLEKLRAAAPQARDQRDRRRRARLKDKHQVRIASGQKIPDMVELTKGDEVDDHEDKGTLSPISAEGETPEKVAGATSEGEDVADRAASMLQGLRGDGDGDTEVNRDGSIRVRRRRESANDERRDRRRRRGAASSSSSSNGTAGEAAQAGTSTIAEEPLGEEDEEDEGKSKRNSGGEENVSAVNGLDPGEMMPAPPITTISPPTPERGSECLPVELSD